MKSNAHEPSAPRPEKPSSPDQHLLQTIADAVPALICYVDAQQRYRFNNAAYERWFGYSREQITGKHLREVLGEDAYLTLQPTVERALRGERVDVGTRVNYREAGLRDIKVAYIPDRVGDEVLGYTALIEDVTEKKRASAALASISRQHQRSSAELEAVVTTMGEGLFVSDPAGNVLFMNPAALTLHQYSSLEEIKQHFSRFPELFDAISETGGVIGLQEWPLARVLRGETFRGYELQIRRKDTGASFYGSYSGAAVHDESGAIALAVVTITDITARRRTEAALKQSEQRYRAFVANSSEGIWRYELDEPLDLSLPAEAQLDHLYRHVRLAELNDAMARMYGYEQADALLDAPLALMLPPDNPAARAYLLSIIEIGYAFSDVESAERGRDGSIRYFDNSMVPVVQNGKLLRAWGVQRDITERKLAEEALRDADRRKDTFLATLAHELRNPLAPIRNGLQILSKRAGGKDEIVQQTLTMMQRQMSHLVRLVDDLLDVSRITRGKLQLKLQRVSVTKLVASAVDASHSLLASAGIELENNSSQTDLLVDGDPDRLIQVISNLLSNAAKFTTCGGRINLEVIRQGQHVLIQVSDSGIGIPAHELERIFEPFTQVDAKQAPTQGGLGIGLSLVRDLVHMHGGTVAAQSDGVGMGSTFIVRLPLAGSSEAHQATATPAPTRPMEHAHSRRILVVDDSPDAAQSLAMLLEIDGHEVQTASNGVEAIEQTATFKPDVIFMDVGMPVLDGMEAARRIRHSKLGSTISIVALTGWGQESDRDRTREAGMDHHLVKPVSADDLREVLRSMTARR